MIDAAIHCLPPRFHVIMSTAAMTADTLNWIAHPKQKPSAVCVAMGIKACHWINSCCTCGNNYVSYHCFCNGSRWDECTMHWSVAFKSMYCQGSGDQTSLVVAASLSLRYWPLQIELHSKMASHAQLHYVASYLAVWLTLYWWLTFSRWDARKLDQVTAQKKLCRETLKTADLHRCTN